jgi:hypothetical protein
MSYLGVPNPLPITASDTPIIDAFGRLRVSNPVTIFDSKQIFDNQPLFWDDSEVSGTGTSSTYSKPYARTRIAVSATTAGKRVRQTFMRFNYQPGKSQQIIMTSKLTGETTGIKAAVGQFDDDHGLFFQLDAGTMYVARRSSVTGSAVDTRVAQASWNIDPMDGTGPSGVTLDPTKTQIMMIDYEWLGVGRVRFGFVVDGLIYYCHEFLNTNSLEEVYISTPNSPLRYEIENDGTGAVASIDHICSTVITEGGQQDLGVLRHIDNSITSAMTAGTTYALIGLRLKSTNLGAAIDLINVSCLCSTKDDAAHWEVRLNPTVAGTFTYADQTNSSVQTASGAIGNTVTGGVEIDGGYFSTAVPSNNAVKNAIRLGADIAGTRDEVVLCVRGISANINAYTSMTWRELS